MPRNKRWRVHAGKDSKAVPLGEQGTKGGVMLPGALGFPPGAPPVIGASRRRSRSRLRRLDLTGTWGHGRMQAAAAPGHGQDFHDFIDRLHMSPPRAG